MKLGIIVGAAAVMTMLAASAGATEPAAYKLTIKDHKFSPETLEVPAGTKVTVVIENQDATPEEFDSPKLRREKVVPSGKSIEILIGPLQAGEYKFVGEYHEDTAHGVVVAK